MDAQRLTQTNYETGLVNYPQVLIGYSQYYQVKINYLQAIAQRLQDWVALSVAQGGGWWNTEEKLPSGF